MTDKKTYSLNSILERVYTSKYNVLKDEIDIQEYENFKNEKIKDLKKICSTLDINLNDFKGSKGYTLPELPKDIIEEYLSQEGKKGSFISKLRSGDIEDIKGIEKSEFIQRLKERIEKNEEYSQEEKEKIMHLLQIGLYNVRTFSYMGASEELVLKHAIDTIKKDVSKLRNENIRDGMIRFKDTNRTAEKTTGASEIEEQINVKWIKHLLNKQAKDTILNINTSLSDSDIDVLIDIYLEVINQASERWNDIVRCFEDIKSECIANGMKKNNSNAILDKALKEIGGFEGRFLEEEIRKRNEDIEQFLDDYKK